MLANAHFTKTASAKQITGFVSTDAMWYLLAFNFLAISIINFDGLIKRRYEFLAGGEKQHIVVFDHHAVVDLDAYSNHTTLMLNLTIEKRTYHDRTVPSELKQRIAVGPVPRRLLAALRKSKYDQSGSRYSTANIRISVNNNQLEEAC